MAAKNAPFSAARLAKVNDDVVMRDWDLDEVHAFTRLSRGGGVEQPHGETPAKHGDKKGKKDKIMGKKSAKQAGIESLHSEIKKAEATREETPTKHGDKKGKKDKKDKQDKQDKKNKKDKRVGVMSVWQRQIAKLQQHIATASGAEVRHINDSIVIAQMIIRNRSTPGQAVGIILPSNVVTRMRRKSGATDALPTGTGRGGKSRKWGKGRLHGPLADDLRNVLRQQDNDPEFNAFVNDICGAAQGM